MARNPFGGFGFQQSSEIRDNMMKGLQQAAQSGNVNSSRMALAQNAANLLVKPKNLRDAENKEKLLQQAMKDAPDTGDAIADKMAYLRKVQQTASEAGLTDISLEAQEKLSVMTTEQEERARLLRGDDIREFQFKEAQETAAEDDLDRLTETRTTVEGAAVEAYNAAIAQGMPKEYAEQNAVKARLAALGARSKGGTIEDGQRLAEELGVEYKYFDINSSSALAGKTQVPKLKQMQTIIGEDGIPMLAFVMEGPNGPEIVNSGFRDADAYLASLKGEADEKVTDAMRKNAAFSFNMAQAMQTVENFSLRGEDFTGIGDTWEGIMPNRMTGEQRQMYETSKETFINAKLRRESGATIKDDEYYRAERAMFPAKGDKIETVKEKQRLRNAEWAGVRAAAGSRAYAEVERLYNLRQAESHAAELEALGVQ